MSQVCRRLKSFFSIMTLRGTSHQPLSRSRLTPEKIQSISQLSKARKSHFCFKPAVRKSLPLTVLLIHTFHWWISPRTVVAWPVFGLVTLQHTHTISANHPTKITPYDVYIPSVCASDTLYTTTEYVDEF